MVMGGAGPYTKLFCELFGEYDLILGKGQCFTGFTVLQMNELRQVGSSFRHEQGDILRGVVNRNFTVFLMHRQEAFYFAGIV